MPSVVGLLEQRELGARRRVDELREEADRIQAELAAAEREWKEWAIARSRVGEVLAPADEPMQDHARADRTAQAAEEQTGKTSQVPVWREGLDRSVLSVDYQRILQVLADRCRL
ncbi:hypothetical protein ACFU5P_01325, partial [Streptomyces sp. NPDC057433]